MFISHRFKAFDTDIFIGASSPGDDLKSIIGEIEISAFDFNKIFSRFDEKSELNRINNANGKEIKATDDMIGLLNKAMEAYKSTDGIFDPTILNTLIKIGYSKSFSEIGNENKPANIRNGKSARAGFGGLVIDQKLKTVRPPAGFAMDLGGIAKGYWVDKASRILKKKSGNFWISAGGDVYVTGKRDDGLPWEIGVQNPLKHKEDIMALKLTSAGTGIATSGITKRHGVFNGTPWHHIIDPRTGKPADNPILSATVIAKTTADADIMAKTILILGIKKGLALINSMSEYECVIIDRDLKIHSSEGIKKYL